MPSTDADSQYAALTSGVGLVDCSDRTQIEVTGEDRAAFLHNFTTGPIRDLQIGQGCEAFVLDLKGHVLGHLLVFCTPETLVLDSVPRQAPRLIAHFERYHIRERVEFHDRGAELRQWLVAGEGAAALSRGLLELNRAAGCLTARHNFPSIKCGGGASNLPGHRDS